METIGVLISLAISKVTEFTALVAFVWMMATGVDNLPTVAPAPMPPAAAAIMGQSMRQVCDSGNGCRLYRRISDNRLFISDNGLLGPVDEIRGTAELADEMGIDWVIVPNCHLIIAYYDSQSGAIRKAALFYDDSFPAKTVYAPPLMGTKKVRVTQGVNNYLVLETR